MPEKESGASVHPVTRVVNEKNHAAEENPAKTVFTVVVMEGGRNVSTYQYPPISCSEMSIDNSTQLDGEPGTWTLFSSPEAGRAEAGSPEPSRRLVIKPASTTWRKSRETSLDW